MLALFDALAQELDPTLDPGLSAIDLCCLGSENNEAVCRARLLVGNVQTCGNTDLIGKSRETGTSQTFVQKSCEKTSVDDGRVTAQLLTKVSNLNDGRQLSLRFGKGERRGRDFVVSLQCARCQVVRSHVFGDLHVRPGLDPFRVCAQRLGERV